jgi:hypothetical protein
MVRPRYLILVLALFAVLAASCSSSDDASDGEGSTTTSIEGGVPETTIPDDDVIVSAEEMCRSFDLFVNAGVIPPIAARSLTDTDLVGATSEQKARYGDTVMQAPRTVCPVHAAYAADVSYWLGF